jgi:outer membrane protein assembly factor BamD (BamD/ComL family)
VQRRSSTRPSMVMILGIAMLWTNGGCRSAATPPNPLKRFFGDQSAEVPTPPAEQEFEGRVASYSDPDGSGVVQASAEDTLSEKATKQTKAIVRTLSGKETEDLSRAKKLYQDADKVFRDASTQPIEQRRESFLQAAKLFGKSAEASEGKALAQDALFMEGESYFFADKLPAAAEAFQKLQKDHPRNRHTDQVAARLFSITRYWVDSTKATGDPWYKLNLMDGTRPKLDTDGHAIRVLDQIRYDDPTGRLADDATMAAAAEYIRQEKYEDADEFLTDLRETFTDSEHLFIAHLLGIQCKLKMYRGPNYSGLVLDEAQELIAKTRQRFPDKLRESNYVDMIARSAAEVGFKQSERLMTRANFREKRREYGAAAHYYQRILDEYGETPQAETARKRLSEIGGLPPIPAQQLAWMTKIFPESRAKTPMNMAPGTNVDPETNLPPEGSRQPAVGEPILR